MFWFFVVASLVCFSVVCTNFSVYLNINNLMFSGMLWNIQFIFDYVSLLVWLMLLVCFAYASFYTNHYFSGEFSWLDLYKIICLFVGVMASLVVTGDYLSTLVFWEYLGVVSYFLILFYLNYLSLRSSVITLVSSRFGDVCLFLLISLGFYYGQINSSIALLLFLLVVLTKSASFPFISWLLEAMRAPTPVSSLVHSSTLVAAGVWFVMRYNIFNYVSSVFLITLLLLITIFISGICCFWFIDLKKIVALSTCNNIAWCVFYLLFGDVCLSLFQLVSHGVSKCLLFMLVGDIMSGSGGSQASNCVYNTSFYNNWGVFSLFSIILGLSGAPYIGVFFTKHFLLSEFNAIVNISLTLFTLFCVFISYFYSFRFCSILLNNKSSIATGVLFSFESGLMVYFWLIINFFLIGVLDENYPVSFNISIFLILFQLIACITAYFIYSNTVFSGWCSSLFGCDNLVESSYLWFNSLRCDISLFIFRWDNSLLSMFQGYGSSIIHLFNSNLLNINMFAIMLFLTYWLIFNV
uniref:NADH:ubiquinone reductase (H(+)-translocating) n=1 Tax=Schyzocotyle nayarensis TaxID=1697567 RepID=A0A172WXU7_SCHNA|nr:NADH dehydrogenase subunit 5 [Schyzocotyle nayarensis]ANF28235.1 NADH dehydrogenase subunit 5 [Schyzocotyle nayarensis]